MGASGHERLAVDDLNSTDVAGQWRERAGHCYFRERTAFELHEKKKKREVKQHTRPRQLQRRDGEGTIVDNTYTKRNLNHEGMKRLLQDEVLK